MDRDTSLVKSSTCPRRESTSSSSWESSLIRASKSSPVICRTESPNCLAKVDQFSFLQKRYKGSIFANASTYKSSRTTICSKNLSMTRSRSTFTLLQTVSWKLWKSSRIRTFHLDSRQECADGTPLQRQ